MWPIEVEHSAEIALPVWPCLCQKQTKNLKWTMVKPPEQGGQAGLLSYTTEHMNQEQSDSTFPFSKLLLQRYVNVTWR